MARKQLDALRRERRRLREYGCVVEAAEGREDQADAEQEAEIADAVDQEGLDVGVDRARPRVPEAISRYDTRPTASQPKNSCRKLFAITSISIEKVNSEMYEKNRW